MKQLSMFRWFLLMLLLALITSIAASGFVVIKYQLADSQRKIENSLAAVAKLKVSQIAHWRQERLADANVLLESGGLAQYFQQFLADPADIQAKTCILDTMVAYRKHYRYARVLLLDANQQVRFSVPTDENWIGPITKSFVSRTMQDHQVLISDLHISSGKPEYVNMDLFVPMLPSPGERQATPKLIGVLMLEIDPSHALFPLLQSWPTPSPTAETLLVRRDGDSVLFLNELRHQPNTALRLRLPISSPKLPAATAVLGEEGVVAGVDYRNVPVLAAVHPIPDSPWSLVSKVDQEEIYSPLHRQLLITGSLFGVLVLATMFGVGLLWRQRDILFLREALAQEKQRESEERYRTLFESAAEGLLVADATTHQFRHANPAMCRLLGYREDELTRMSVQDIHPKDALDRAISFFQLMAEHKTSSVQDLPCLRKDGTTIYANISASEIVINGRKQVVGFFTDVTQRKLAEDALRQSQKRLRDLIEGIGPNMFVGLLAPDGTLLETNRASLSVTGLEHENLLGTPYDEISCWSYSEEVQQQLRAAIQRAAKGEASRYDVKIRTAQGQFVYLDFSLQPLRDENGKIVFLVPSATDITERKLAEDALRQSQKRLRNLIDGTGPNMFVGLLTPDGRLLETNRPSLEVAGLRLEDLLGMPFEEAYWWSYSEEVKQQMHAAIERAAKGEASRYDVKARVAQDRFIDLDFSVQPLRDDSGTIMFLVPSAVDITERKRAEEEVQKSQRCLRSIIDGVGPHLAIGLLTPDGTLLETSCPSLEFANLKSEDLLGKPFEETFWWNHSDDAKRQLRAAIDRAARGEPSRYDVTVRVAENQFAVVDFCLQPLRDEAGEIVFLVPSASVITERKRAEEELQRAHDELEQRVADRTAQLAAKNEELKGFAYTVSHDLKAPLRGIAGYANELGRKHRAGLGERAQFCVNQILTATHSLDCLIEDLLHYSRLDAETPTETNVSLLGVVEAIVKDRGLVIAQQHAELAVEIPNATVRTWERGLLEVLTNLIDNALKYSRNAQPPRVVIRAEESEQDWRIAVSDNGVGFDMRYHDRIFGLFNRLVREEEFEGTGAGLAIAKKMVDKLGGRLWAQSAPGQGATFFVEIPKTKQPARPPSSPAQASSLQNTWNTEALLET